MEGLIDEVVLVRDNRFDAEIHGYEDAEVCKAQDKDELAGFHDHNAQDEGCKFSIIFGLLMELVDLFE